MTDCTKCKNRANIKINVLNYCNVCFQEQLKGKIEKQLSRLDQKSSMIFLFPKPHEFFIIKNILNKYFTMKMIHNIELLIQKKYEKFFNLENDLISYQISQLEALDEWENDMEHNKINSIIIEYITKRKFKVACYMNPLESILSYSLEKMCLGDGLGAVENVLEKRHEGFRFINLFCNVKYKELTYFLYLKNFNLCSYKIKSRTKVNNIIRNFLLEIDNKNSLAFFNILNTLKKLNKN